VPTVARELRERWDGAVTRLSFYTPYKLDDSSRQALLATLR
jgi:hypothetical protein